MHKLLLSCAIAVTSWGALSAAAHDGVNVEIAKLDTKIQKEPHNTALYIERAMLLRREGQFGRALVDLAQAQKLDPHRREIVLEKGLTLAAKGETKEAESLLSAYLASGLPSAKAFEARGKIRENGKRFVEARADYSAAVALAPGPDLFLARGRMDEALGHWDDAARGYAEGLRILSGAIVLRLALVRVEHQRGHYDRAIALIDDILPTLAVKADWLLLRADQHAAAGQPAKARQDREEALREADARLALRPTDFGHLVRAKALIALERKKEAVIELEMVVAHAPKLEEARQLLDEIRPGK
jgi:tetratricopeptide (TPR) repeat protein